jgi:hypothetical protein
VPYSIRALILRKKLPSFYKLTKHFYGRDSEIHIIHWIVEHVASLEYPTPCFEGNFIGLMDKVGEFGNNLWAINGVFFEEVVVDSVHSAEAVAMALAATTLGYQLVVAANKAATWVHLLARGP